LIYDDFRKDNEGTVRRVLRFLELDDEVPVGVRDANPTVRMRSQWLDDAVHAVSVGVGPVSRTVKALVKAIVPAPLRRRALSTAHERLVLGSPRSEDEVLSAELRQRFRGEVVALSEYLDRDLLSLWGYDDDA
jgi:hypothetical protein